MKNTKNKYSFVKNEREEKNMDGKKLGIGLLVMTLLVLFAIPGVLAVAGPGEVQLNCSYTTPTAGQATATPTSGITLVSTPEHYTIGQTYNTTGRNDLTFSIRAMANSNSTNTTVTTVAAQLFWDGFARASTNVVAGLTNDTSALNATFIVSNDTEYTHTYYMRFYFQNYTAGGSFDNITGCAADVICTHYAVNDPTLPNVTIMDCPTRTVTIDYKALTIVCGDGICSNGETATCAADCASAQGTLTVQKSWFDENFNVIIGALIVIGGLYFISKKK